MDFLRSFVYFIWAGMGREYALIMCIWQKVARPSFIYAFP